ncbi:MAG: type II toxin-antitoxin system VapC family toxin [Hyphomicrobium sp.]
MRLVVDASVALKWFLAHRTDEQNLNEAAAVGSAIQDRKADLYQPPHWNIEVVSVLVRTEPQLVDTALLQLSDLEPTLVSVPSVLRRAADIAVATKAHLFDTLYHAVALEVGATLVTADERYFAKASCEGSIILLKDFTVAP